MRELAINIAKAMGRPKRRHQPVDGHVISHGTHASFWCAQCRGWVDVASDVVAAKFRHVNNVHHRRAEEML